MDPTSPKPDINPEYYLYHRQPHKNLRIAHDASLIIPEKRERKPANEFLPDQLSTEHDNPLNRNISNGKSFQPTSVRKNTHISPQIKERSELDHQMRQQEWPDNAHKKLITEQNFDDRAIHRAIMPMQISHQGFQIPGHLINSFLSPFMSGYSNYNTILRNFPQPQPFNRIEYFNPDPLSSVSRPPELNQNIPNRSNFEAFVPQNQYNHIPQNQYTYTPYQQERTINYENRQQQQQGELNEELKLNGLEKPQNFGQQEHKLDETANNSAEKAHNVNENSENLANQQPSEQPVKRKRGRPKGSKLQHAPNETFSQAISDVARMVDLKHVPRELKKLMSVSDLRLLPNKEGKSGNERDMHAAENNTNQTDFSLDKPPSTLGEAKKLLPPDLHNNFLKILEGKEDIAIADEDTNHTRLSSESRPGARVQAEKRRGANKKIEAPSSINPSTVSPKKRGPKKQQIETQKSETTNNKSLDAEYSMQTEEDVPIKASKNNKTFVNCDLRYFNLDYLVEKLGHFDVDPPWRNPQQLPEQGQTTSKSSLEYNTFSNQEIMDIRIDKLSHKGFIFLWIPPEQLNISYEMIKRWGYEVVDQIIWVKMKASSIFLSDGDHFMHSYEMCLVGYKCPAGEHVEYNSKISNNIIFADLKKKSRKPDELYDIIDLLMPGSKKVELFARNHNLRPGWFSLGNQLGDLHDSWFNELVCNECQEKIKIGVKRYKGKKQANYDICEKCFKEKEAKPDDFFEMDNAIGEDVLHQYHQCAKCNSEPIWGTRFACKECENYDLCEACFDLHLQATDNEKFHDNSHEFAIFEVPIQADMLPTHPDVKCYACLQKPIVGPYFACQSCTDLAFCQNCYFTKPIEYMRSIRGHLPYHQFEIVAEPHCSYDDAYKCQWCETKTIEGSVYKCDHCFEMYFCEKCYLKRESYKPNLVTAHKIYHSFTRLNAN